MEEAVELVGGSRSLPRRADTVEPRERPQGGRRAVLAAGGAVLVALLALVSASLRRSHGAERLAREAAVAAGLSFSAPPLVQRIAFGSCTAQGAHDGGPQPIWTDGVVPSQPDAWIWLGDFAYLDYPSVDCLALPNASECNCPAQDDTFYRSAPFCLTGDPQHAAVKYRTQLRNPDYVAFLDYMCPLAREAEMFPPPGLDRQYCPRPILGTYDDHDYGWDNGDRRLPDKWLFKNMFLDALGEPAESVRRNIHRGLWHKYVLNEHLPGHQIEVFVLDGRYERDSLPCYIRREWCEEVVLKTPGHNHRAFCLDLLHGGPDGSGTCCRRDEEVQEGWCVDPEHRDHPLWEAACDWTSESFGTSSMVLDRATGELRLADGSEAIGAGQDPPFCDVLGCEQREWLHKGLKESTAALRVVVSGSVVVGSPGAELPQCDGGVKCICNGDDWDCYRYAQRHLLHAVATAPGCTVLLVGDYHFADIKKLLPGHQPTYSGWYATENNTHPIFQVMSSGLTTSTARSWACDTWLLDPAGLRDHPECDIVTEPNFGVLEVDFAKHGGVAAVRMQIRDGQNKVRLESILTPAMCPPVKL